jgi:cytochrome c553
MDALNTLLKKAGIGLAGLVGVPAVAAVVLCFLGGARLERRYHIDVAAIAIPTDAAAIERGRHLAEAVTLCHACHGERFEGAVLFDDPWIGTVYAPDLTADRGGAGDRYTTADYVRAIRHGVNREGRGLFLMHSDAFHNLGEADLSALVGYVRSVPPANGETENARTRASPLGRILIALGLLESGAMPLIAAETIDHDAPFSKSPVPGATSEYGRYLVSIAACTLCHGTRLRGGPAPEEAARPAPDVVAWAAPGVWSERQFIRTLRSGVTPWGKSLDPDAMPWRFYARMTDMELGAIWRFLASRYAELTSARARISFNRRTNRPTGAPSVTA